MSKWFAMALALALVVTGAGMAWAEYGTWEQIYNPLGGLPPGLSNAGFLGMSVVDQDELYTVGIYQDSALTMKNAWATTDGGYNWTPIHGSDFGDMSNECNMLKIMNMPISIGAPAANQVRLFGFGVDEECLETTPFPACLFVCMFKLLPLIEYSDDGGQNWETAAVTAPLMSTAESGMFVDENVGYAAGGPRLILRTQDGGKTWNKINAPGDNETYFNGVNFITPEYGFVWSGEMEDEGKPSAPKGTAEWAEQMANYFRHRAMFRNNLEYRLNYVNEHPDAGKGTNGKMWRTVDGGQTWELIFSDAGNNFVALHIVDEDVMWLMGDPHTPTIHYFTLYLTEDGGDTWTDVTARVPQVTDYLPNSAGYAISAMSFQPSGTVGFLGGASGTPLGMYKSLIYYTEDGGQTWAVDTSVVEWGHPVIAFGWATDKLGWSANFDLSIYKYTQLNTAPIADAGPDQTVATGDVVSLDGSASYDPDGDDISYTWVQTDGETVELTGANSATPSFTAPAEGDYTFNLAVSDGTDSDGDDVVITATASGDDDDTAGDDDTVADDDDDNGGDDDDDDDDSGCGC